MAKTEHYFTRFENDCIYHVYNRSIDRKPMFKSDENYAFFIRQFDKYLSNFVKIYSYNLLGNHFHFMIKINDLTTFEKLSNLDQKLSNLKKSGQKSKTTHDIVSQQFKKFFQSYAMAYNKQQNRTGTLFQTPFKRALIENEEYLRELSCYINTNAEKHNIVNDFKDWKWSSYHNLIASKNTKLLRDELFELFGNRENFIFVNNQYLKKIDNIEKDFLIED